MSALFKLSNSFSSKNRLQCRSWMSSEHDRVQAFMTRKFDVEFKAAV